MLDRKVIQEFLDGKLMDWKAEIPPNISMKELTETFCLYMEDDYYQWLMDNSKSFFAVGNNGIDWNAISIRVEELRRKQKS